MNKFKFLLRRYRIYKLYDKYYKCSDYDKCQEIATKIIELEKALLSNERNFLIKQAILAYCPKCNQEMYFHPNTKYENHGYEERITCGNCNHTSNWDYSAPTPILLNENK